MSGGGEGINLGSNKYINIVASIILLIVGTVAAVILERMGSVEEGLGEMSHAVERISELDTVKERVVKLELAGNIISHAQLSATESQYPSQEGDFLRMASVDSLEGSLEFDPRRDSTTIRMVEDGTLFLVVAPQVRRVDNYDGEACFVMWLVIGGKDLANSSIKECFFDGEPWRDTRVSLLQAVLPMHARDTLQIKMRSDPEGKVGVAAIQPEGVPLVPAAIVSVIRLGG